MWILESELHSARGFTVCGLVLTSCGLIRAFCGPILAFSMLVLRYSRGRALFWGVFIPRERAMPYQSKRPFE